MKRIISALLLAIFTAQLSAKTWSEDFENLSDGQSILEAEGWRGFQGFPGESKPSAVVRDGTLAISCAENYRADNFGVQFVLPEAYSDGVVWIRCRFKQPQEWKSGFFLDARGTGRGEILARVSADAKPYEHRQTKKPHLRWHATWSQSYWRLYSLGELNPETWQSITLRLNLDTKSYAAWVDGMRLGEDLPFASEAPFGLLHLSVAGAPDGPALIDDLSIGREAPPETTVPQLLPEPEDDLVFRFAAIGDPQLGMAGYDSDKARFRHAVDQVNQSGAELSLILGDMVQDNDKEEAYIDCAEIGSHLKSPAYYIRGNHERLDLYQKHFHEKSDFAVVHKGVRFVVIDAIGYHAGLTEQQLTFVETEFSAATDAGEDIVLSVHVSPWQNNEKGRVKYNQIGPGRERLRELMKEHQVALCLSGHLHTGLWGAREEETQYLVLPGTALAKTGPVAWCAFDVYPDRIVMHQKPLFFAYENADVTEMNGGSGWSSYESRLATHPYTQRGPLTIPRRGKTEPDKPKKPPVDPQAARAKIDALVAKNLEKRGIEPNPPIADDVFLSRAYLTIAGRIPTPAEARAFYDSSEAGRRERLIDELLGGEGYVSHFYNYWADILRLNEGLDRAIKPASDAYNLWVKQALRDNLPYDEFVHRLITASDAWWEDGAIGYFVRDRGMPLDAMANTTRVFLGTRIECAQCHDHPFDKWTQMDFYQLAAFTYGIDARQSEEKRSNAVHFFQWHYAKRIADLKAAAGHKNFPELRTETKLAEFTASSNYRGTLEKLKMTGSEFQAAAQRGIAAFNQQEQVYAKLRPALDDVIRPVNSAGALEVPRELKLPHDYQYDNAAPGDVVPPSTLFGDDPGPAFLKTHNLGRVGAFGDWLTSSSNPRFTRVIVNRLWKRVFGAGLFEPVDDLNDYTPVTNPELLAYLEELFVGLDFDMKGFLAILCQTDAWQRAAVPNKLSPGQPLFDAAGPLMQRMTAEQIWDSIIGLSIERADEVRPLLATQLERIEFNRQIQNHVQSFDGEGFIAMLDELGGALAESNARRAEYREARLVAQRDGDEARYAELGQADYRERRLRYHILWELGWGEEGAIEREKARKTPTKLSARVAVEVDPALGLLKPPIPEIPAPDGRTQHARRQFVSLTQGVGRASELESPAPRGHFLRDFGQSDRAEIQNADNSATVPQALNLLNGPLADLLANRYSVLGREIHEAESNEDKVRLIFQGMLTREPTAAELEIALAEFERDGEEPWRGILWALLNNQQFVFVP